MIEILFAFSGAQPDGRSGCPNSTKVLQVKIFQTRDFREREREREICFSSARPEQGHKAVVYQKTTYRSVYGAVISEQAFSGLPIYYMEIFNTQTATSTATLLPYLLLCLPRFLSAPKQLSRVCLPLLPTPRTPMKKPCHRGPFRKCCGSFHGAQNFLCRQSPFGFSGP